MTQPDTQPTPVYRPYEHTETDPRLFPHLEPTCHSPMVQGTRLAVRLTLWVVAFLALMALVAGCNPQDDSGTDGVVDPTSEAETDSGSQP